MSDPVDPTIERALNDRARVQVPDLDAHDGFFRRHLVVLEPLDLVRLSLPLDDGSLAEIGGTDQSVSL